MVVVSAMMTPVVTPMVTSVVTPMVTYIMTPMMTSMVTSVVTPMVTYIMPPMMTSMVTSMVTFVVSESHGGQAEEDDDLHFEISAIWDVTETKIKHVVSGCLLHSTEYGSLPLVNHKNSIPKAQIPNWGYSLEVVLKPWNQWSEDASSAHSLYTSGPNATLASGMKTMRYTWRCVRLFLSKWAIEEF